MDAPTPGTYCAGGESLARAGGLYQGPEVRHEMDANHPDPEGGSRPASDPVSG